MTQEPENVLGTDAGQAESSGDEVLGTLVEAGQVGVFGKLPAHGDFVSRRLSREFINYWDEWLQRSVAVSQEQMGDRWLDYYLVSPIWRFVLSAGVVDKNAWAGMLLPSVDSVGRYFPLTVAVPIIKAPSLFDVFSQGAAWFQKIENCVLEALHENLSIDELNEKLTATPFQVSSAYSYRGHTDQGNASLQIDLDEPEQNVSTVFPLMLEHFVRQQYRSFSAWWSQGSEYLEPSFNIAPLLPDAGMYASFLDGQWQERGWQQPFSLSSD